MTIGSEFKQAREQRGLTLVQISERTKVRVAALRAIEGDAFQQLPGGVIARGFLKLYAREVGLDADAIVARFQSEFQSNELERRTDGDAAADAPSRPGAAAKPGAGVSQTAAVAVALVALLAIGYFSLRVSPDRSAAGEGSQPPAAADAPAAASSPTETLPAAASPAATPAGAGSSVRTDPATATASGTAGAPGATPAEVLRVDLEATAACWLSATVDGKQVAYRALNPGERLALRATTEVVLRVGIPGNLTVSINDRRMPPPARPGTPVTLRITPANYRDLVGR